VSLAANPVVVAENNWWDSWMVLKKKKIQHNVEWNRKRVFLFSNLTQLYILNKFVKNFIFIIENQVNCLTSFFLLFYNWINSKTNNFKTVFFSLSFLIFQMKLKPTQIIFSM
jgi:hypothetical protein